MLSVKSASRSGGFSLYCVGLIDIFANAAARVTRINSAYAATCPS